MPPNTTKNNSAMSPSTARRSPYVLLTRLTAEDINRLTGTNQDEQPSSNTHVQTIQIKQEYPYGHQEADYNEQSETQNTVLHEECSTVVKIETITTTRVKTELPDDYPVFDPPHTPCTDLVTSMPKYKCDRCQDEFISYESFIIHKTLMHENMPYVCKICDKRFSLRVHLNCHLSDHVNNVYSGIGGSILPTDIQSSSRSNLAINYYNHNSTPFSQVSFNSGTKNAQSKKKNTNTNMSVVSTQKYCASNLNKMNGTNCLPFKCTDCLFSSVSEMSFLDHLKDCKNSYVPENERFNCHVCTKTFTSQAALNAHMKYHTRRGEFASNKNLKCIVKYQNDIPSKKSPTLIGHKCKECNRKFISRRKLHVHLQQHKKQMMCKICRRQYFLEKAFKKHMLTHDYKKNGNSSVNENHKISSVKSTKYKSVPTKAIAHNQKHLRNGLKNKNQNSVTKKRCQRSQPTKCNWCSVFITKCNLLRHINNFHPNVKPVKCVHCPKKFKNHASMRLHKNDCHKQ